MYTQTMAMRTHNWATYASRLCKLGQHLDWRWECSYPLSCSLYLEGSAKEKWCQDIVQPCLSTSPTAVLSLRHPQPPWRQKVRIYGDVQHTGLIPTPLYFILSDTKSTTVALIPKSGYLNQVSEKYYEEEEEENDAQTSSHNVHPTESTASH